MSRLTACLCPLLSTTIIEELKKKGIRTVVDYLEKSLEELVPCCSLSYKDLVAIRRVILAKHSSFPVSAAILYEDVVSGMAVFSTGCDGLDMVLEGGFYTGDITELVGQSASGKTLVCVGTALNVAFTTSQADVLYIDSSGSFSTQNLQCNLENAGVSDERIHRCCSRIRCVSVFDVFELLDLLHNTARQISDQGPNHSLSDQRDEIFFDQMEAGIVHFRKVDDFHRNVKLVIIDSITAVLSPLLGGQHCDGHGYMAQTALMLKSLARQCSLAVVIVNSTVSGDGGLKPALGRSWQSIPNSRILLQSLDSNQCKATVLRSCLQATGRSVVFNMSELLLQPSCRDSPTTSSDG